MFNLSPEVTIPLIILVGFISAFIASIIGLGGGLVSIPLIMIVIGEHNQEAKLIGYVSIMALGIMASIKYARQKRKPDIKVAILILIGVIPTTVISETYIAPLLAKEGSEHIFHFLYAAVAFSVVMLVNLKSKIKVKKLHNWTLPIFGLAIGLLTGSVGLSGGVLFIPLLVVGMKKSLKEAAITSLILKLGVSITNIAAAGANGYFGEFEAHGVYWYLPLIIVIGSLIGSFIGPIFQKKISDKSMQLMFNIVMAGIILYEIIHASLSLL